MTQFLISLFLSLATFPALAGSMALPDLGASWIEGRLSEEDFWSRAHNARGKGDWSELDQSYLTDLYELQRTSGGRLLCEDWREPRCGDHSSRSPTSPAFPPVTELDSAASLETVPFLAMSKDEGPSVKKSFWKSPWFWGALIAGGFALRGKKIVLEGPSF